MDFMGIDAVVFASEDPSSVDKFFKDWGLKKVGADKTGITYVTGNGGRVIVQQEDDPGLVSKLTGESQFREVIFAVKNRSDLATLKIELEHDRNVRVDADGTLHTVDDAGINIGFRVSNPIKNKSSISNSSNSSNSTNYRSRINQVGKRYVGAQPWQMGHIVFFVPDTKVAENFYRKRLGFWLSDRYVGGAGVFLRWAKRSEHHNLFFIKSRTGKTDLHHIAFEVQDIHEVFGGGVEFARRGWKTEIGPGRHPLSSAYFWYFKNPLGGAVEYFCDPDFVTEDWKPHQYRVNRFSEWHLSSGIPQVTDGSSRPSLAVVKAMKSSG